MRATYLRTSSRFASALLAGGLIWAANGLPAAAQTAASHVVTSQQILDTLAPPVTRSLTVSPAPAVNPADQAFVEGLRHRTRSLTIEEGDKVAEIAKDRTKINLEINFDFNSAAISDKGEAQVKELGEALRNAQLEKSVIVISGYTDAKGTDPYNQKLSERRAEAVKAYLVDKMKLSTDNLVTGGYGKRHLKNTADPYAAENRRVEIVNMNAVNQASR